MNTFEILNSYIKRMEDSLNKESAISTGNVDREQLIEIRRLAENLSIRCNSALRESDTKHELKKGM